jgi:eukaryotic-like serine/threonine-protein kinase
VTTGVEPATDSLAETVSSDEAGHRAVRPDMPMGVRVGRYITTGVLGRGGMGVVYAAHDPVLRRPVALKLLHSAHPTSAGRLIREAQALARLSNPHVVAVYDAGEYDGDQVFIAMQHVDGQDLATVLAQRRPSRAQILDWFIAAGRGLAAAHAAGLVHRDFKPANVLLDRSGNVAVTDFGLAREVLADGQARQTNIAAPSGTPAYMSPEQHSMQPASQASDQFSFCLALWEALFAQHPFVAGSRDALSIVELGCAIVDAPLIPPPQLGDVPGRVAEALARGLERQAAARWPSMPALLAALAPTPRLRRGPILIAGLVGAGMATAGALAFMLVDPGGGPAAVPGPPAPTADPIAHGTRQPPVAPIAPSTTGGTDAAARADHPAAREAATVTLRLTVDPAGAAIALDGARVQGTELVVVKDLAAHLLHITASGYLPHDALIAFDEDQRVIVQLKRGTRATRGTDPTRGSDTPAHDPPKTEPDLIESHSPYE